MWLWEGTSEQGTPGERRSKVWAFSGQDGVWADKGTHWSGVILRFTGVKWWLLSILSDDARQDEAWQEIRGGLCGNPWWRL